MIRTTAFRAVAVAALAPLFAACEGMLTHDTIGTAPTTTSASNNNANFIRYAAIGTSISAGIQSGGINDSTQREGFVQQLALAMGLTPGVDWYYPAFRMPGCPPPFTNPLTSTRVGGGTGTTCLARDPASIKPYVNNVGIPFLRAQQAIDVTLLPEPRTDTLALAQFITGSQNPVDAVLKLQPTFVSVEVGANDVLHAATRGDTTLLTPVAAFTAAITAIADSLLTDGDLTGVAWSNIPNVTTIPFLTRASVIFCLKNGPAVCGPTSPPATPPFNSPLFTVDASCAPNAGGGIGDTYLLSFNATGAIANTLAAARGAKIDCGRDSVLIAIAAPPALPTAVAGPSLTPAELTAVSARVTALNGAIQTLVTGHNWALVNLNAALGAIPVCTAPGASNCVPPIPNLATPSFLFGSLFSLDGVHPTKAGHRLLAQTFAAAINTTYGTLLTVP